MIFPWGRGPDGAPVVFVDEAEKAAMTPIAVQNEEKAKALLAEAERFRREHPRDRGGAVRRFREVVEQYPRTLAAFRAQDLLEKLEAGGKK